MALPPEFRLALWCCRLAFDAAGAGADPPIEGVDWHRFLATVERHRIAGLAWRALAPGDAVPDRPRERLAGRARVVAAQALRGARDAARIDEAFGAVGIDRLFLKGCTLAALAYDDASIKAAWDIDVLVGRSSVEEAGSVLEAIGYRLVVPRNPKRLVRWHRWRRESVWAPSDDGPYVELHTGLADNRLLIGSLGLASPRQRATVTGGARLETFADAELFAYLCVHGASSAWFRLKWLADFAALLAGPAWGDLPSLYWRSQQLGAGRSAAQATLLARRLFGSPIDPALLAELQSSAANRRLTALALGALLGPEPTSRRFGTAGIHLSQFGLSNSIRFKLREFGAQVTTAFANRFA